jgi:hypothetical protein
MTERAGNPLIGRRLTGHGPYADDESNKHLDAYLEASALFPQDLIWSTLTTIRTIAMENEGIFSEELRNQIDASREQREIEILQAPHPGTVVFSTNPETNLHEER